MRPDSAGKLAAMTARHPNSGAKSATGRRAPPPAKKKGDAVAVISAPANRVSELHLRRRLRRVVRSKFGHWLVGADDSRSPNDSGEGLEVGVVNPHRFDVVAPGD